MKAITFLLLISASFYMQGQENVTYSQGYFSLEINENGVEKELKKVNIYMKRNSNEGIEKELYVLI